MSARAGLFLAIGAAMVATAAGVWLDATIWSQTVWRLDVATTTAIAATTLGAALVVISIAISVVQSATEKWPAYIYQPINAEQGRSSLLSLTIFGLLLCLGALLTSTAGDTAGMTASLLALAAAALALIGLGRYVIVQLQLFDPLNLAEHIRRQMRAQRRSMNRPAGSKRTEKDALAQQQYLSSLDRMLGLSRWLGEQERAVDAMKVIQLALDEIASFPLAQHGQPYLRYWSVSAGQRRLPFSYFPPSTVSFAAILTRQSSEEALWLEAQACEWISRSLAYISTRDTFFLIEGWNRWLELNDTWIAASSEHNAPNAARAFLRWLAMPLLNESLSYRPLRDRLATTALNLYIESLRRLPAEERDTQAASMWKSNLGSAFHEGSSLTSAADSFAAMTILAEALATEDDPTLRESLLLRFEDLAARLGMNTQDRQESNRGLQLLSQWTVLGRHAQRGLPAALTKIHAAVQTLAATDTSSAGRYRQATAVMLLWLEKLPKPHLRAPQIASALQVCLQDLIDAPQTSAAAKSLQSRLFAEAEQAPEPDEQSPSPASSVIRNIKRVFSLRWF